MPPKISLSIFLPAYNEESNIEESVTRAKKVVREITDTYEIIVIDDGSKDKTGSIIDNLATGDPHVRAIHHNPNQGYGAALWSGFQAAQYDYIFFTDADLQFDLNELHKLVEFAPSYDAVIGYRYNRQDSFMRILNAWGWNILNRALFGLRVKDIDCAFKIVRSSAIKNMPLRSRGAMISAEMLIRMQRDGAIIKEIPVTHLPRIKGSATGAKLSVIFRAFKEMIGIYRTELGNSTHIEFVKFGLVGVINTCIDFFTYLLLTRATYLFDGHLVSAKALSFFAGTVSSFTLNRYWTFGARGPLHIREIFRFYSTVGTGIFINVGSMYMFTRLMHLYDIVAVIASTFLTLAWGFAFSKYWVFAKDKNMSQPKVPKTQTQPQQGTAQIL